MTTTTAPIIAPTFTVADAIRQLAAAWAACGDFVRENHPHESAAEWDVRTTAMMVERFPILPKREITRCRCDDDGAPPCEGCRYGFTR